MSVERWQAAEPGPVQRRQQMALQLLHACQAYTFLEQRTDQLRQQLPEDPDVPADATIEAALRGVRLVIFARFTDLIESGNAATGQLILSNTLERPRSSSAHRPNRTSITRGPIQLPGGHA